jgi:hypothetical protein
MLYSAELALHFNRKNYTLPDENDEDKNLEIVGASLFRGVVAT